MAKKTKFDKVKYLSLKTFIQVLVSFVKKNEKQPKMMDNLCFQINKLHLCKPLIRAIDSLPMKDKFSLSHLITFR